MSESGPVRLLVSLSRGGDLDYATAAAPLLRSLQASGRFEVQVGQGEVRPAGHQVVLAASERPRGDAEAAALAAHLRAGGGLVVLGATVAAWSRNRAFADLLGWAPAETAPAAELRVRPAPGGLISPRLDSELLLWDRLHLGGPAPEDAEALITVAWRSRDQVAAFRRRIGAGHAVYLGLGSIPGALREPALHQLTHRCVRAAVGLEAAPPIGVGLYGYGAIGREHAGAVPDVEGLELRGICDRSQDRLTDAARRFAAPVHLDAAALLADPAVELVVVGVPPALHASAVLECLAAGKHVVCEKPFALREEDADRMLAAAADGGRMLTVYQSRRWDPDFRELRDVVRSGAIGSLFYMESFIGGFGHPCSYWHSHAPVSGGTVFDWGSHFFDWMLQLLPGDVVRVAAGAHKRVWHDVTNEDQVRVDLTFEGGEQATFMQSDVAAALKPKWYLLGTEGAIVGDWRLEAVRSRAWTGDLVEERLQPGESPARVRIHRADRHGAADVTELALPPRAPHGFYRNLADHLLLGEPLAVPAAEARRNVAIMEAATRSAADGGRPAELRA
jgi:predicted dehydrogenase